MKKGFTIIELMVASLLLAMLVTVLTSIFNQSSIAWRTGTAGVADMDEVRNNMAQIREEADNVIVHDKKAYSLTGLWDDTTGELRKRAVDVAPGDTRRITAIRSNVEGAIQPASGQPAAWKNGMNVITVGSAQNAQRASRDTYTVNVKSAGPDLKFDTYDDIWSFPDEFDL